MTELTPKEKALEIINFYADIDDSKESANYAIYLVLSAIPMYTGNLNPTWKYWNDVKSEIENL